VPGTAGPLGGVDCASSTACWAAGADPTSTYADVITNSGSGGPPPTTTSSSTTIAPSTSTTTSSTTTTSTTTTTTPTTSVTTTQVTPGAVTLGSNGSVTDNVTVQGTATNGAPTGTVAFYVCRTAATQTLTPGPCAPSAPNLLGTAHVVPGSGDVSRASSNATVPTAGGTWCFSATFTSSSSYQSSADNTGAGNLDPDECVLVGTATSVTASYVSAASVTLGPSGTINDSVTVSGNVVGGAPSGTVAFYLCRTGTSQSFTPGGCAVGGSPADSGETLVAGAGASSSTTSADATPTGAGTWCYAAVYGGDGNYLASSDNTSADSIDPNQCVLVTTAASSMTTSVSASTVAVGAGVNARATVTGNSAGGPPAGSVAFFVCGPVSAASVCTSIATHEGAPALKASGSDSSSATSSSLHPSSAGVYCFAAVYVPAGTNYAASSANQRGSPVPAGCVRVVMAAYAFTSDAGLTVPAGRFFTFPVTTFGSPAAKIARKGRLPKGVHLVSNHNGTATLSGTPGTKHVGGFPVTLTATFGKKKAKHVATQTFTLTVVG